MDADTLYELIADAAQAAREERLPDDVPLARRFVGGELALIDGEGREVKRLPIDTLFKKVTALRERLRVMEQKVNNHEGLDALDRAELQASITRCYGTLTTFNLLFREESHRFRGTGGAGD
jgi:hypothetical protein